MDNKTSYLIINISFAGIIMIIMMYSGFFSPEKSNHPLPSACKLLTGEECQSTGLSRSFSALVRLNYKQAKEFNQYGPRIFGFFSIQFLLRLLISAILLRKRSLNGNRLVLIDSFVSLATFLVAFWPFLEFWTIH